MSIARNTADRPTNSDIRIPNRIVENTSLPQSSVPSTKNSPVKSLACPGGVKPFIRLSVAGLNGSCGAITGAKSAPSIISSTTTKATTATGEWRKDQMKSLSHVRRRREARGAAGVSMRVSAMSVPPAGAVDAQARVDREIEHVDDQVDTHEHHRNEHQIGGHDGNIHELDRVDEEKADAGPLKHRLGDDREGDDRAQLQAGDGDHRHQSVLERVAEIDGFLADAAGAGKADVIHAQHLQHLGAHQPQDQRHLVEPQRDRGQYQRLEPAFGQESGGPPAHARDLAAPEAGQPAEL